MGLLVDSVQGSESRMTPNLQMQHRGSDFGGVSLTKLGFAEVGQKILFIFCYMKSVFNL